MRFRILSTLLLSLAAVPLMAAEDYSQWQYSSSIVVNTTGTGANVTEEVNQFPLLVRLTPQNSEVFANTKANGADLRFTKADGVTRLPHQIERWDKAGQMAEIWVKVDTVVAEGYTTLRMFWSNAAAADSSKGTQVFESAEGFVGVWHMGDASGFDPRPNAVSASDPAVLMGHSGRLTATPVQGAVGLADSLRGNGIGSAGFIGDHFSLDTEFPTLGDNGSATISMWVKPASFSASNSVRFLSLGNSGGANSLWMGRAAESKLAGQSITGTTDDGAFLGSANSVLPGEWQYVTYVIDNTYGTYQRLSRNGVQLDYAWAQPVYDIGRTKNFIGRSSVSSDSTFRGVVDEVTISNVPRNASWIKLSYETQKQGPNAVIISERDIKSLFLTGPPVTGEDGAADVHLRAHYADGLSLSQIDTMGNWSTNKVQLSASTLKMKDKDSVIGWGTWFRNTEIAGGKIGLDYNDAMGGYYTLDLNAESDPGVSLKLYNNPVSLELSGLTRMGPDGFETTGGMYSHSVSTEDLTADNIAAQSIETETLRATEVVTTPKWEVIPDYVFEKNYQRKSLAEVESFVRDKKHLPGMPSARQIADKGMSLTEMNLNLLRTVEELTLHVIDMNKDLEVQKRRNRQLEKAVAGLQSVQKGK